MKKMCLKSSVVTVSNTTGRVRQDAEKSGLDLQGGGCGQLQQE